MLPNLSALALAPATSVGEPPPSAPDPLTEWRDMNVLLYNHLVSNEVGNHPSCGLTSTAISKKRGLSNTATECEKAGFLMAIALNDKEQTYYAWFTEKLFGAAGAVSEWKQLNGVEYSDRLDAFKEDDDALALFGSGLPNFCTDVDFSPYNPKKAEDPGEFTYTLINDTSHYFLDVERKICIFATEVKSKQQALELGLLWNQKKFMYLHLICSGQRGGGVFGMSKLETVAQQLGCKEIQFAALPRVWAYYYTKLNARFFNGTTGDEVPLPSEILKLMGDKQETVPKVGGEIVEPMNANKADYELYRSQRDQRMAQEKIVPEKRLRPSTNYTTSG